MEAQPTPLIEVQQVSKRFGDTRAVDQVSLTINDKEFFALLGPSGCGKTTLLRMMAGFETPDKGSILLDGQDMTRTRPWERPVNMMFQSYALFPHMNVFDNVAYGLKQGKEKLPKPEIDRRVNEVLEMVSLRGMANRRPATLSGGQRQRVALARAVVKRPRVLLLDEPLAALDRKLRVEMRLELKRLQEEVGIAFVIVTHDQEEALTMADRAAVMSHGKVLQVGSPEHLYEAPASLFVASFIGESNVLRGTLNRLPRGGEVIEGSFACQVTDAQMQRSGLTSGAPAAVVVRPEHVRLRPADQEAQDTVNVYNAVYGTIIDVVYLGSLRNFMVELPNGQRLLAQTQAGQASDGLHKGQGVVASWNIERGVLVPGDAPAAESEAAAQADL